MRELPAAVRARYERVHASRDGRAVVPIEKSACGGCFRTLPPAVLRGTALGSILGVLPGGGALLAAFAAYTLEKKLSKTPERFGKGAIEGVASPEAANNSAAQAAFTTLIEKDVPAFNKANAGRNIAIQMAASR